MDNLKTYQLRMDVVASVLEDGAVLLDLETKYFYLVNPSGWAIIQMFETGCSIDKVISHCPEWSGTNQTDPAVLDFIEALVDENLIEISEQIIPGEEVTFKATWEAPTIEKQKEPLQKIMTSAFDPTMPLAE
jgi:hypothetical protein